MPLVKPDQQTSLFKVSVFSFWVFSAALGPSDLNSQFSSPTPHLDLSLPLVDRLEYPVPDLLVISETTSYICCTPATSHRTQLADPKDSFADLGLARSERVGAMATESGRSRRPAKRPKVTESDQDDASWAHLGPDLF